MSNAILMAPVPVFFVLLPGYAAGKFHVIDNLHVDALNALVMDFVLPASLFAATASASRSEMIEQGPLFLVLGMTMLPLHVAWCWAAWEVFKASRSDASLQALTIGFPNLAGVGLPILSSVVEPAGTVPVAVAPAAGSILVSPLTLIMGRSWGWTAQMHVRLGAAERETRPCESMIRKSAKRSLDQIMLKQ